METFVLWVFVAYSTAQNDLPGGAALGTQREYFYTLENCRAEAKKAKEELSPVFKRVVAWCLHREEPGKDLFNLDSEPKQGRKKGG